MLDSQIIQAICTSVWAMEPDVLEKLYGIAFRHAMGERLSAEAVLEATGRLPMADDRIRRQQERRDPEGKQAQNGVGQDGTDKRYELAGSVALVPMAGVIAKYASQVNGVSQPQGTSVEAIRRAVTEARASSDVGSVVLRVESPGGTVDGIEELAAELAGMRSDGGPPVYAYAERMASAAYWLGSAAGEVYATTSAMVGSIGVYTVLPDTSAMFEKAGVKMHLVKAGEFKGIGERGVPVTAEQLGKVQERVDQIRGMFIAAVERGRPRASSKDVAAWATGDIWLAAKAHEMGLIDGVKPLGKLIEDLNAKHRPRTYAAARQPLSARSAAMDPTKANETPTTPPTIPAAPGTPAASAAPATPATPAAPPVAQTLTFTGADIAAEVGKALTAETNRQTEIQAAAEPYAHHPEVAKLAKGAMMDRSVSPDVFRGKLLTTLQTAAAVVGTIGTIDVGASGWERERGGHEMILLSRLAPSADRIIKAGDTRADKVAVAMGFENAADYRKRYTTAEQAGLRRQKLMDMGERFAMQAVAGTGHQPRGRFASDEDILGAAFGMTTSDFPKLLQGGMNKSLLAFFSLVSTSYQLWCGIDDLRDFKNNDLVTLSELPELKLLPPGQNPEEGKVNERAEGRSLQTYGRMISVDRKTMINDDLSGLTRRLQAWGFTAALLPESLAYAQITANGNMVDGSPLFHANHRNLQNAATLSHDALVAAMTAMMTQKGFGQDTSELMVTPKYLLVPTALWATAEQITKSIYDPTKSNTNSNVPNVVGDKVQPISSVYLHRNSQTAWYVAADPMLYPLVMVSFLNGRRDPFVNPVGNGSILGQSWEVIFDCTAKSVQWEAGQKNPGA